MQNAEKSTQVKLPNYKAEKKFTCKSFSPNPSSIRTIDHSLKIKGDQLKMYKLLFLPMVCSELWNLLPQKAVEAKSRCCTRCWRNRPGLSPPAFLTKWMWTVEKTSGMDGKKQLDLCFLPKQHFQFSPSEIGLTLQGISWTLGIQIKFATGFTWFLHSTQNQHLFYKTLLFDFLVPEKILY